MGKGRLEAFSDGVIAILITIMVLEPITRHGTPRGLAVVSVNTSARVELETGKEYIVFASPNVEGQLEAGNYCDRYSGSKFKKETEQKVVNCLRDESAGRQN
jgi:hypothetical protein